MTEICQSELYSNQTICAVKGIIEDHIARAEDELANANSQLDNLASDVTAALQAFDGINYTSQTGSVNTTFAPQAAPNYTSVAPTAPTLPSAPTAATPPGVGAAPATPAAHTVPVATTKLISAGDLSTIYDRQADRLARVTTAQKRNASYRGARQGIGMSSASLTMGLKEAENKALADVSTTARDSASKDAEMIRDDIKALHELHIANWPLYPQIELDAYKAEAGLKVEEYKAETAGAHQIYSATVQGLTTLYDAQIKWVTGYINAETDRLRALIASESERRAWSQMEVNLALAEADALTKYAIEKLRYLTDITKEVAQAKAQLITGAFQALISAANVSLTASAAQNVSE